jgi:hypothetical protein
MSYPNLTSPTQYKNKGDYTFNVEMMFEADQIENFYVWNEETEALDSVDLKTVLVEISKEMWPGESPKEVFVNGKGWPLKNGDKKAEAMAKRNKDGSVYNGKTIISAKAKLDYPPMLFYKSAGKRVQLDIDYDEHKPINSDDLAMANKLFQGGNYGYAEINFKAVEIDSDSKYITPYLNMVQYAKDGEKLGKGSRASRFDGIDGGSSDFDPTAHMGDSIGDDEVPF